MRNLAGHFGKSLLISLFLVTLVRAESSTTSLIKVVLSAGTFNPSIGQSIDVSIKAAEPGKLEVQILDRDGFVVRHFPQRALSEPGVEVFTWDGRDDRGHVVADESYSLRAHFKGRGGAQIYFSANGPTKMVHISPETYDHGTGVLRYTLPFPARVHVQAGWAKLPPNAPPQGPVLKTIVNRQPRLAGAVIEQWNGFDESGTVYVADDPNFVVGIAATQLPENSVITVGNRSETFIERALKPRGKSLFSFKADSHHHHQGLDALNDFAPTLMITPLNAKWSAVARTWTLDKPTLRFAVELTGLTAAKFAQQPANIEVFLDMQQVAVFKPEGRGLVGEIPLNGLSGPRTFAINWSSKYGPAAVNAVRLDISKQTKDLKAARAR